MANKCVGMPTHPPARCAGAPSIGTNERRAQRSMVEVAAGRLGLFLRRPCSGCTGGGDFCLLRKGV